MLHKAPEILQGNLRGSLRSTQKQLWGKISQAEAMAEAKVWKLPKNKAYSGIVNISGVTRM